MALSYAVETFCNILSTTIIIGGLSLKIPQIIAVLKAGNTKGLSLGSVVLEECAYSVMLTYHFASGYPIMTYLEYTVLQYYMCSGDLLLIMLILHYNDQFNITALAGFIVYFAVYNCIAFRVFPDIVVNASVNLVLPPSVTSKVAQIRTIYTKKDAGQVSLLSFSIAAYGCIGRIVTTVLQTGDTAVLISFLTSGALNLVIVALIIVYKSDTKKKLY